MIARVSTSAIVAASARAVICLRALAGLAPQEVLGGFRIFHDPTPREERKCAHCRRAHHRSRERRPPLSAEVVHIFAARPIQAGPDRSPIASTCRKEPYAGPDSGHQILSLRVHQIRLCSAEITARTFCQFLSGTSRSASLHDAHSQYGSHVLHWP